MKSYYVMPGLKEMDRELRINLIIDAVSKEFDLETWELQLKTRARRISEPRQVAQFLAREYTSFTLREIGEFIGNQKHDVVIHAISKTRGVMEFDRDFRQRIERIKKDIGTLRKAGDEFSGKTVFDFKWMNLMQRKAYLRRLEPITL